MAKFTKASTNKERKKFHLPPQCRRCLQAAAFGLSSKQIQDRMNISLVTVNKHIQYGMSLLGVRSRTHAVSVAIAHKLIRPHRKNIS